PPGSGNGPAAPCQADRNRDEKPAFVKISESKKQIPYSTVYSKKKESALVRRLRGHLPQNHKEAVQQGQLNTEGQHIRNRLGQRHAGHAQRGAQHQQGQNEQKAAAQAGKQGGGAVLPDALEQHVGADGQRLEEQGSQLQGQGGSADAHHDLGRLEHGD